MDSTVSKTFQSSTIARPVVFGLVLGVLVHVIGWFVLPTETTLIGLGFFTLGIVLAFWAQQWWLNVGRVLVAVGLVLLIDDVIEGIFFSGPLI